MELPIEFKEQQTMGLVDTYSLTVEFQPSVLSKHDFSGVAAIISILGLF